MIRPILFSILLLFICGDLQAASTDTDVRYKDPDLKSGATLAEKIVDNIPIEKIKKWHS